MSPTNLLFLNRIALFCFSCLISMSCARLPKAITSNYRSIATGKGAEDLVLDSVSSQSPRLLISCNDHRLQEKAAEGDIYVYELNEAAANAQVLPRVGEPVNLQFHPHGIFFSETQDGPLLYVISHIDAEKRHPILVYKVFPDSLVFQKSIENKAIYSPNSVTAMRDGGFYITNDLGKRNNRIEAVLKQKKGSIVYCSPNDSCQRVAEKLSYANGLLISPNEQYLYVSTTAQNKVFQYQIGNNGSLINRTQIAKVFGGDNLRWSAGKLIIAGHYNFLAFAAHAKNPEKKSPSVVFEIDIQQKSKKLLYADKGAQISAASVGLTRAGKLYIGQVFQDFIIEVPLR